MRPPPHYWMLLKDLLRANMQILHGIWKISKLQDPIITIFGGTHVEQSDLYAQRARAFAHRLAEINISVITGAGPGIMEAATCGASLEGPRKKRAKTLGITVKSLYQSEHTNICIKDYLVLDYFFARKWLMINYSMAFVVFPGGFGTLDEMMEVLTLIQTHHLPRIPLILIGTDYWNPLIQWLENYSLKKGLISRADFAIIHLTDNLDEAFTLLKQQCKAYEDLFENRAKHEYK